MALSPLPPPNSSRWPGSTWPLTGCSARAGVECRAARSAWQWPRAEAAARAEEHDTVASSHAQTTAWHSQTSRPPRRLQPRKSTAGLHRTCTPRGQNSGPWAIPSLIRAPIQAPAAAPTPREGTKSQRRRGATESCPRRRRTVATTGKQNATAGEQIATVGAWTAQACWGVALCRPGARAAAAEPSTSESVEVLLPGGSSVVRRFVRGTACKPQSRRHPPSAPSAGRWSAHGSRSSWRCALRPGPPGPPGSPGPPVPVPAPVPEPAMTRA